MSDNEIFSIKLGNTSFFLSGISKDFTNANNPKLTARINYLKTILKHLYLLKKFKELFHIYLLFFLNF